MPDMNGFTKKLKESILKNDLNKDKIAKLKIKLSKEFSIGTIPSDIEILMQLAGKDYEEMKYYLSSKPTRNISGVHVVAIMSKPNNCPHGTCIMCPGGLKSAFGDDPKSYTGNEPATMRAIRNFYDPYLQIFNRLQQYVLLGIYPQKIELILMGGTFLFFDKEYKDDFIKNSYKAMNDFSLMFYDKDGIFLIDKFKTFFDLPRDKGKREDELKVITKIKELKLKNSSTSIIEEQTKNDLNSFVKCIGLTIETKPDYGRTLHGLEMLSYGCTRVELGVQTLFDKGLTAMHRGHDMADTIGSIAELRDLGFKLNFHIMIGVPGLTAKEEKESLVKFFSDDNFKPDMIKIYPLMVMPGTGLQKLYEQGKYTPINATDAAITIADFMGNVEPYCRVMRVQRDIPPKHSIGGVNRSNLRQYVDEVMNKKGIICKDIREREIGNHIKKYKTTTEKENFILNLNPKIVTREYSAANGKEFFISIEDKDVLLGFVRLRFPNKILSPEITNNSAIIRELHVYGTTALLHSHSKNNVQHKGHGKMLMKEAEKIAKKYNKNKIIIISGVGVRGYYRKLGYTLNGPYMTKKI